MTAFIGDLETLLDAATVEAVKKENHYSREVFRYAIPDQNILNSFYASINIRTDYPLQDLLSLVGKSTQRKRLTPLSDVFKGNFSTQSAEYGHRGSRISTRPTSHLESLHGSRCTARNLIWTRLLPRRP